VLDHYCDPCNPRRSINRFTEDDTFERRRVWCSELDGSRAAGRGYRRKHGVRFMSVRCCPALSLSNAVCFLRYAIFGVSALQAFLLSFSARLNPAVRWRSLRAASLQLRSEIWKYARALHLIVMLILPTFSLSFTRVNAPLTLPWNAHSDIAQERAFTEKTKSSRGTLSRYFDATDVATRSVSKISAEVLFM